MKKIVFILAIAIFLAGCGKQEEKIQSENEGYFNEGYLKGLEKSYKGSKEKINDAANKENKKLQDALDAAK